MQLTTNKFNWHKDTATFSVEASDMKDVWGDKIPSKFVLVSARTGNEIVMLLSRQHKDNDGDITHWEYIPQVVRNQDDAFTHTVPKEFKLIVWND